MIVYMLYVSVFISDEDIICFYEKPYYISIITASSPLDKYGYGEFKTFYQLSLQLYTKFMFLKDSLPSFHCDKICWDTN